jgi:GalNAc-alpha-(1->4)-GalNAc-alpha-(1->3)-diNAcBac-PP-undecaprenol alpha-1,4-N-acetyl-D-galactosaminyltransferase
LRLYPRASRVVVLNQRAQEFFDKSQDIKTMVMPNPVVLEDKKEPGNLNNEVNSKHIIVAMGRLSQEKCFDLLIQAYSLVATKFSDWNLMILGEGPEREALETLREELGLGDRIMLPGTVRHPHQLLKRADMFVSSSELEGFPMALCEAMACGLPVIAVEYHSAVHDIVEDGHNGILVPAGDKQVLADTMIHLIEDPGKRSRLAANSPEIGARFGVDAVMKRWEQLLKEVTFPQNQAAG